MPGSSTISSGYTSMLQQKAVMCDQARILARLNGLGPCCPPIKSNTWPPASSVLELKAQSSCSSPMDILTFPKTAMTSSTYTRSLENNLRNALLNDPSQRFAQYTRFFPPPCPPPTITNAGIPKAPIKCSVGGITPPITIIT